MQCLEVWQSTGLDANVRTCRESMKTYTFITLCKVELQSAGAALSLHGKSHKESDVRLVVNT